MVRGSTLVTGGCGFIGTHLVRRLVAAGAPRVFVVDSFRYGTRESLAAVGDLESVEIVEHDLGRDPIERLAPALGESSRLVHLAAEKHTQSLGAPLDVIDVNVRATYELFTLAAAKGVRRALFASSLQAYGRMSGPPLSESEVPRPTTVYGISKLAGERLLAHASLASALAGVVLRYFFVYGPHQFGRAGHKSLIVRNFERMARGEPPQVCGDGEQTLDYLYVDDAVDATLAALEAAPAGACFNVGSGQGTSINALTEAMARIVNVNLEPMRTAPDWTAGSTRVADTALIRRELGWAPKIPLEDGLRRTFAWLAAR